MAQGQNQGGNQQGGQGGGQQNQQRQQGGGNAPQQPQQSILQDGTEITTLSNGMVIMTDPTGNKFLVKADGNLQPLMAPPPPAAPAQQQPQPQGQGQQPQAPQQPVTLPPVAPPPGPRMVGKYRVEIGPGNREIWLDTSDGDKPYLLGQDNMLHPIEPGPQQPQPQGQGQQGGNSPANHNGGHNNHGGGNNGGKNPILKGAGSVFKGMKIF